jgi:uncharacterized protein YndB with AHSA1/START domain
MKPRIKITIASHVALLTILGLATAAWTSVSGPVAVTKVAGPPKALRFEVTVPASVDQVWTAFTTKDGLATWLWPDVRIDLRPGGDWLALFKDSTAGGTIVSVTAKRRLVIAAMAPEKFPTVRRERTTATFDFASVTAGSTRVTLMQTGWKTGPEWDAAYDYLAAGDAELLAQLHQRFVSGPIAWPKGQ